MASHLCSLNGMTIHDFLQKKSKLPAPLSCTLHSQLGEVADSMIEHRVHRIWIKNTQEEPIGVLTFTDIFSILRGSHS